MAASRRALGTLAATAASLVAFAANSLLARAALAGGAIDAVSFTTLRLASGAVALLLVVRAGGGRGGAGSWASALALFGYALAFSLAYLTLSAGTGALVLFGAVQATMIGAGLAGGERPRPLAWLGLAVAVAGLIVLLRPGLAAPSPLGAALMAASGACWGIYSLRGRTDVGPVAATAGNFLRAAPLAVGALGLAAVAGGGLELSPFGAALAVLSGVVTSGLGYVVWYTALGGLSASAAGVVQLAVPVLAALGGVALLGERFTARLALASVLVLGGIGTAIVAGDRRRSA